MDWTQVIVALCALIAVLATQYVLYNQAREAKDEAKEARKAATASQEIIAGNGRGNVGKMLEDLQDGQALQGHKITSVLAWQGRHEARHDRESAHKGE